MNTKALFKQFTSNLIISSIGQSEILTKEKIRQYETYIIARAGDEMSYVIKVIAGYHPQFCYDMLEDWGPCDYFCLYGSYDPSIHYQMLRNCRMIAGGRRESRRPLDIANEIKADVFEQRYFGVSLYQYVISDVSDDRDLTVFLYFADEIIHVCQTFLEKIEKEKQEGSVLKLYVPDIEIQKDIQINHLIQYQKWEPKTKIF